MTILQRTITGSVIYSHFRYLCPYHTWLIFNVGLPEIVPAPSDRLLMQSGIKHEEAALRYFQKRYGDECSVIQGEEGLSYEEDIRIRFERTVAAMSEGKPVIYHGILAPDERMITAGESSGTMVPRGETDFLFRMDKAGEGRFDGYHYEVGDAKSSRSSKFCQQMQVTFYSWLLERIQGVRPQCGRVLTRPLGLEKESMPFRDELFLIDDHIWTLMTFMEEEFREILEKNEGDFFFHPKSGCGTCPCPGAGTCPVAGGRVRSGAGAGVCPGEGPGVCPGACVGVCPGAGCGFGAVSVAGAGVCPGTWPGACAGAGGG